MISILLTILVTWANKDNPLSIGELKPCVSRALLALDIQLIGLITWWLL